MPTLISIVIPIYNQERYLAQTLDSVIQQTYPHFEAILVDDGSRDKSALICEDYCTRDRRFVYISQSNQGPSAARNAGIRFSSGQYLCLLDGDDLMNPLRLEKQLDTFQQNSSVDIVYSALCFIDEEGHELGVMRSQDLPPEDFLVYLFFRNLMAWSSSMMAKRRCLIDHLYHPDLRYAEDYELALRLAHHYCFKYIDIPLTSYRRHRHNVSNALEAHRKAELDIVSQYSIEHINSAIQHSLLPEDVKALMKGKILFNRELWAEALTAFQPIPSALAYFYQGNCYLKLNRLDEAISSFHSSLELDSSNPACHNNLGAAYWMQGEKEKARSYFQQALKLKTGYLDAQFNLTMPDEQEQPKMTLKELRQELLPYRP